MWIPPVAPIGIGVSQIWDCSLAVSSSMKKTSRRLCESASVWVFSHSQICLAPNAKMSEVVQKNALLWSPCWSVCPGYGPLLHCTPGLNLTTAQCCPHCTHVITMGRPTWWTSFLDIWNSVWLKYTPHLGTPQLNSAQMYPGAAGQSAVARLPWQEAWQ